jgi:hypothetical protein
MSLIIERSKIKILRIEILKSECWDLNPRPPLPQSGALPSCATSRYIFDAFQA